MHEQEWILINCVSKRPTQGLVSSADPLLGRGPRKARSAGVFAVAYSGFFLWLTTIEIVHSWTYCLCSFLTSPPRIQPQSACNIHETSCPMSFGLTPALQPSTLLALTRTCERSSRVSFFPLHLNVKQLLDVMAGWHPTIPTSFLSSFLCDWINYVSLTLLEVSKHTFSVISHQSMWPWRWKVKHVSQEAGQRGIRPLISGPSQSHHSRLPWELKLSLWAMYSELQTLDLWCMLTLKQPIDGYQIQKHVRIHQLAAEIQK